MGKDRKTERWLFDLPPRVRRLCGSGSKRAKERQTQKERALAAELRKEFTPVFRMAVASDLHISADKNSPNAGRLEGMLRSAYRYSDNHPAYQALDAVLFVGDNATSGAEEEYDILLDVLQKELRPGTKLIPVMGNHEYHHTGHAGFIRRMGAPLDPHETVKGFHIIGLSTNPTDTWHTPKQALWMLRQLRIAAKDAPGRPIFTMQHGHIWKTVYVSRSWYTQLSFLLHPVYARFPQVINFSGHSHGPINHPLTVWQKKYTAVGAGTLSFFEMERDIGKDTIPAGSENAAQYLIVETDAGNRVRILPYNVLTDDFFRTTNNDGKEKAQLVFLLHAPGDRKSYVYTPARAKTDPAPQFDKTAAIELEKAEDGSVTVSFPQAHSPTCVYGYRAELVDPAKGKKPVRTAEAYSGYYYEPMPERCACTLRNVPRGRRYEIRVYPLNVWRDAGEPLKAVLRA